MLAGGEAAGKDSRMSSGSDLGSDVALVARLEAIPSILASVAQLTGMRFVAVARVTDTRWVACAVRDEIGFGLGPGGELPLETTICNEIRQHGRTVVFGQASLDPQFCTHPTPKLYGFQSYLSVPIFRGDGSFFGTLCAIDPAPAKLDARVISSIELFTRLIAAQMDAEERVANSVAALRVAEETAKLRDQFIAVVGHDLRSPLQAIQLGTQLLTRARLGEPWDAQLLRMLRSCARMTDLVDNILDFARGRLGGGIPIARRLEHELEATLRQVVAEVQAVHPDVEIERNFALDVPVPCDGRRVAQLLTNLLVNAVTHGAHSGAVAVTVRGDATSFELAVHNRGEPIADEIQSKLFRPFWRSSSTAAPSGLGLGLYISAEIARAHGGSLTLESSREAGTTFTFRMPTDHVREIDADPDASPATMPG
jgi:signal transduction histidine kinase